MANEKVNKVVLGSETLIDITDSTVTSANLLSGAKAYGADGEVVNGNMANQGAKTASLNAGESYTIPQGYHNGSGVVTANSLASQTVGTASANEILSGFTAWVNGVKLTGTATSGGATITVRYSSSFYNKTITCSNGSKTYTKTTTSSGSTEFSVSDRGTWTITCNGTSVTVDVTFAYTTLMKPDGKTITPVNDIQIWLNCGGIFNKTYTTINQVLADTTTLLALISDNNAVDYMVRSTNWASSVCANATAMTDIGANNYCANTLLADSTWRTAICNSTYFESVLNVKVPVMTSNTTPSGTVHASVENLPGNPPYYAFDGQGGDGTSNVYHFWADNTVATFVSPCYLQYTFDAPVVVNKVRLVSRWSNAFYPKDFTIYGSNDGGVTKVTLLTVTNHSSSDYVYEDTIGSNTAYTTYGADFTSSNAGNIAINVFQFYGRASS